MIYCWKILCSNFPVCCCYASSFLDQGSFIFVCLFVLVFLTSQLWKHLRVWLCFNFHLWKSCCWGRGEERSGGEGEGLGVLVTLTAAPSYWGCSRKHTQYVTDCKAKAKKWSGIPSWKGNIGMQSIDFLGSGAAFGVSVRKKDGLHLRRAWLVMFVLMSLYIPKTVIRFFFFKLEKPLCTEDSVNLRDSPQAYEIMKIL